MELTEFVLARVAEDEAVARGAIAERQRVRPDWPADTDVSAGDWPAVVMVGGERRLAECEAVRRIVALHTYDWNPRGLCMACDEPGPCDTLRALASIWRDHEQYDPAWEA